MRVMLIISKTEKSPSGENSIIFAEKYTD